MPLIQTGTYLGISRLDAKGDFPPAAIVRLFDPASGDVFNYITNSEIADALDGLGEKAEITVELRQSRIQLAPPVGKGNAYRLRVIRLVPDKSKAETR